MAVARPLAVLLLALSLAACFGAKKGEIAPPPPKPSTLQVVTTASGDLNPDGAGRASPLQVRVYALRNIDAFQSADFFTLFEKDETVLAADLVKREELTLHPGESTKPAKHDYGPDTAYIAVMGAFRDFERSQWRAVAPLKPGTSAVITISADAKSVAVEIEKSEEPKKK